MAQETSALALDHDGPAARRIAGFPRERLRNRLVDDGVGHERVLCGSRRNAKRDQSQRHDDAADHPNVSLVMARNQAWACSASSLRAPRGAPAGLMTAPPSASAYWSSTGR